MASPERSRDHTVSRLLVEQPQRFEFFEAVRILERMMPDRASIGGDADPRRETLRFTTHARLGFPSGDLERIELPEEPGDARPSAPARVQLNFMSLLAPNSFGSLPTPYAVLARDEERAGRTALRDFLDVFTHRFVSLFYRAWGKSRIAVAAEHAHASYFERGVLALLGLGTPRLQHRLPLPDQNLLSRAGLLLRRPASAAAIEALVESYFGVRARIEPFRPVSAQLEPEDRTRLGRANVRLGEDAVIGSRVVLRDARFRLRIGPLSREEHESFLPHGDAWLSLCRLVRLAISSELEFDVQLVLRAPEVPRLRLTRDHPPTRLGRSTWLLGKGATHDRDDPVLTPPQDLLPSRAEERATRDLAA